MNTRARRRRPRPLRHPTRRDLPPPPRPDHPRRRRRPGRRRDHPHDFFRASPNASCTIRDRPSTRGRVPARGGGERHRRARRHDRRARVGQRRDSTTRRSGTRELGPLDLHHWVNDGLMAVFFFVVGLEIKRELVAGELQRPARGGAAGDRRGRRRGRCRSRSSSLIIAGGEGARGLGDPGATDIAFAVGVLALLGDRVSRGARGCSCSRRDRRRHHRDRDHRDLLRRGACRSLWLAGRGRRSLVGDQVRRRGSWPYSRWDRALDRGPRVRRARDDRRRRRSAC